MITLLLLGSTLVGMLTTAPAAGQLTGELLASDQSTVSVPDALDEMLTMHIRRVEVGKGAISTAPTWKTSVRRASLSWGSRATMSPIDEAMWLRRRWAIIDSVSS